MLRQPQSCHAKVVQKPEEAQKVFQNISISKVTLLAPHMKRKPEETKDVKNLIINFGVT